MVYKSDQQLHQYICEPSGKALGWEAEGPRFESGSALLSLQKLWTLSRDFVPHS